MERYEQLRAGALQGAPAGGMGLALLLRGGVSAWARAWPATRPAPTVHSAVALAPGAEEIVGVLAAMALACITTTGG